MKRVIIYNEHNRLFNISRYEDVSGDHSNQAAISLAVITLARQTEARLILAETFSGRLARHIVSFRPDTLVLGVTNNRRTYQQLCLVWGVHSYLVKDPETAPTEVVAMLKQEHNVEAGDIVIRTSGSRVGVTGTTNTIQIEKIS